MNHSKIHSLLKKLNLSQTVLTIDESIKKAHAEKKALSLFLEEILEKEVNAKLERRVERRIKESKLPELKLLSDFDFNFQKGVNKSQVMELSTLSFVERGEGLILAGNSGTGKSHLSKSFLLLGCKKGFRCRYTTASDMLKELLSGLADDTLEKKLKPYINVDVLLIDELGFDRLVIFVQIPLFNGFNDLG